MSREQTTFSGRILSQFGLSARLLLLTVLFVMIAEVLIYVPSVANFRLTWLNDRLAAAQIAAMVLDAAPEETLSEELEMRLLQGVGARAIALRGGGRRSLLAAGDVPPEVSKTRRSARRAVDRPWPGTPSRSCSIPPTSRSGSSARAWESISSR